MVLATPLGRPARYAARHIRRWLAQIPIPLRLSYGAWWLVRNDNVGEAVSEGFEASETYFVERFVKPGMTVLDVGANQGYYTLLASRMVGNCGRVISIEPSPREVRALLLHVKLNRCKNVTVAGIAAGGEKKQADLFVVQGYETGCNSLRPPVVFSETAAVRVEVVRLDDWLEAHKIDRVDFMKLDVEGGELEALKGAERMLERRPRPVILMEVQDLRTQPWGYRAKKVIEHLQGKGFRWMQLGKDGALEELDLHLEEFDGNFVAWPEELASGLETIEIAKGETPNATRRF